MAALSVIVWLCAIGIFIGGIVRLVQKKVLQGLGLLGLSVIIWIFSIGILASSSGYEAGHQQAIAKSGTAQTPVDSPDAQRDIEVVKSEWRMRSSIVTWDITLHNKSKTVTYADINYRAVYDAPSGTRLTTHRATIYEVLKPGETRRWPELSDGFVNDQAKTAGFVIVTADAR